MKKIILLILLVPFFVYGGECEEYFKDMEISEIKARVDYCNGLSDYFKSNALANFNINNFFDEHGYLRRLHIPQREKVDYGDDVVFYNPIIDNKYMGAFFPNYILPVMKKELEWIDFSTIEGLYDDENILIEKILDDFENGYEVLRLVYSPIGYIPKDATAQQSLSNDRYYTSKYALITSHDDYYINNVRYLGVTLQYANVDSYRNSNMMEFKTIIP